MRASDLMKTAEILPGIQGYLRDADRGQAWVKSWSKSSENGFMLFMISILKETFNTMNLTVKPQISFIRRNR